METSRNLTIKQRAISILLSIVMVIASIPSALMSAFAGGPFGSGFGFGFRPGGFGPNVLTNVSVSFYDSTFKPITEVDSGQNFYLSVQLAGNNVNDPMGTDHFRLEITDNNLLLPNFADDGFKDGAVYNGFTLHVDGDKRYLEYDIKNGDTKMIRLQAKFANGKTPDNMSETVKLIQTTTNKSVSNTITANSALNWSQSKGEDKQSLNPDDLAKEKGVNVNYTLSATSNNAGKKTAAWWAKEIHFKDSISGIPEGVTATVSEAELEAAIKAAGFTDYKIINAEPDDIDFIVYSNDTDKEMDNVKVTFPVNYQGNPTGDNIKITNTVKVTAKGIGSDTDVTVGSSEVSLEVPAPPTPPPDTPMFRITKSVDRTSIETGDSKITNEKVVYTITVENYGTADGEITIVEDPGNGITLGADGFEEKTLNLKVGDKETFKINATISGDVPEWGTKTFTNHVYEKDNSSNGAYASTNVGKKQTKVGVSKTGYVGDDTNNKWFTGDGEEKVTYEITFNNWGDTDETVTYEDILSEDNEMITWDADSIAKLSGTVTVLAGKTETITLTGTIKAGEDVDKIENKVTSDVGDSNTLTFNRSKAIVGVTKEVENGVTTFNPGDTVTWHIKVSNSGNIEAKDVVIWDKNLEDLDGWDIKVTATNGGKEVDNPPTVAQLISDDGFTIESIAGNTTYDITISAKSPEDAKGKISNTASWTYDGETNVTNEVTVEPKQYDAEKWIVDEKGKTLVESDGTVVDGFDGFVDGNKVTFRAKFTNNSNETYEDLYMSDWCELSDLFTPGIEEINIKVVETTGNIGYTKGQVLSLPLRFNDQNAYSSWQVKLEGVNSTPSSSFTLEYTLEIDSGGNSWRWGDNHVGFDEFGYEVQSDGGLAFTQVKIPRATSLSYSKETDTDSVDINNEKKFDNGVLVNGIDYTITFTPNNEDENNYTNHTFTITDTLPKGMTYKAGSIKVGDTEFEIVGNPSFDPTTSTLIITLKSKVALSGWGASACSISYTALISDELAEKIKATPSKKPYELINTVNKVEISGDTVNKTIEQEATAKTTFTNSGPAPGFAKAGIASIPGGYDEDGEFNRAEHGFITAGDTLVWDLVIYNGDGSTNYNESNTGEFNISGMKITDILPNVYECSKIIGAGKVKLNTDGQYQTSEKETGSLKELNNFVEGSNFVYDALILADYTDSSKAVFTIPEDVTLKANEAYVIRICTTIKDGMETEGVITNRGFLTTKEEYTQSEVTAGEPKGKEIWNSANYNIVGLTTESYKTINYTGHGHTIDSDGHNDPIDDTGFSRDATHNYVQGVQGEKVTYELHIINTSPIPLEQWTIIDRLPYIGDVGLVSGYERSSAFNVMMGEIKSVKVADVEIEDYKVYYSSDKTTVLNEYSEDWLDGKSGEMQWYDKPRKDSVNFRITIPEQYKVGNNQEIVITFTGTVPNYVEKTGESNIAWNSFAYGYKSPDVLGDTVMVAEPAKVGVWVETPETSFDITINKEVDGTPDTIDRKFYFAIFDNADINKATRLSDVFEVVVSKNETTGKTVLENIDRKALGVNQANKIYILETDKDGKALKGYTTEYINNVISADMTDTEQTITVKNTKQVGSIKVTKKVAKANESVELTADNFFFALFTVDEETGTFVRYADAPVKKAAYVTTSESIEVTFDNIPTGEKFYVLETDSKGILADNKAVKDGDSYKLPDKFTSTSGNVYDVTYSTKNPVTVENGKDSKIEITNTKAQKYEIIVDKSLVMENVSKVSGKFKVELVEYDVEKDTDGKITSITEKTATEKKIKEVTPGTPVKFENLTEGYYRVYELYEKNGEFKRITSDDIQNSHEFTLSDINGTKKEYELRTSYDGAGDADNKVIELNSNQSKVSVGIANTDKNPNKITVNKTALQESSGAIDFVSGHKFNVALFKLNTKSSGDNEKAVEFEDAKNPANYTMIAGPFKETTGTDGKCSIQIDKLTDGENLPTGTYYVFEIVEKDGEITPLLSGSTLTVDDKTFIVSYSSSMVTIDGETPAEISVTDASLATVPLRACSVSF